MSPLVLVLMYILAPVAWPTAKLLDRLLGEEHGTTYKKAGLKTLVTLHKSLGEAGEQLNQDEVTIISAVLDLKAKPVGNIMTPMDDVFTMSSDTVLDEKTMEVILGAGYSRIPIHAPDNSENFVGMLLVKILITYDPEDGKRVSDFALATLPETRAETSCLDIVNFFQEGKSHMVLVSEYPGEDSGALGVVTLEDVIEELIGEEIIDESDVYIDVHKAIRRMAPAPRSRIPKGEIVEQPEDTLGQGQENLIDMGDAQKPGDQETKESPASARPSGQPNGPPDVAMSPQRAFHNLRRTSSAMASTDQDTSHRKGLTPDIREHLKHLGPSNPASRPRTTRYNTVKVKPGAGAFADLAPKPTEVVEPRKSSFASQGGVGAGLLNTAGKDAKDGVLALQAGYGSIPAGSPPSPKNSRSGRLYAHAEEKALRSRELSRQHSRKASESTIESLESGIKSPVLGSKRGTARSGSITENIIDAGGIKKTVLELTSSSDDPEAKNAEASNANETGPSKDNQKQADNESKAGKKKRRRKKKKGGDENEPLLGH